MAAEYRPNTFTLIGPPRAVPTVVRTRVLFGGFLNQFGWVFFGFGMVFVWIFVGNSSVASLVYFRGELATTQGRVSEGKETGARVNERPVYENHYSFTVDGQEYKGVSYATSRQLSKGEEVTIEYPLGDPSRSRIEGMRTALFPPLVLLVALFPFIGLCLIGVGLKRGFKAARLLRDGLVGYATLKSKTPTSTQVNNQTVYKLSFEFSTGDGETYTATAKTHQPKKLEDEEQEPLLYDPFDPSYAVLLDNLPGQPRIDEMGAIKNTSSGSALAVLILPTLATMGNGLYAMWRF